MRRPPKSKILCLICFWHKSPPEAGWSSMTIRSNPAALTFWRLVLISDFPVSTSQRSRSPPTSSQQAEWPHSRRFPAPTGLHSPAFQSFPGSLKPRKTLKSRAMKSGWSIKSTGMGPLTCWLNGLGNGSLLKSRRGNPISKPISKKSRLRGLTEWSW